MIWRPASYSLTSGKWAGHWLGPLLTSLGEQLKDASVIVVSVDILQRDNMAALLARAAATGGLTVKLLVDSLAVVTEFEMWVVKKFTSTVRIVASVPLGVHMTMGIAGRNTGIP
jgi:hypothetical protein